MPVSKKSVIKSCTCVEDSNLSGLDKGKYKDKYKGNDKDKDKDNDMYIDNDKYIDKDNDNDDEPLRAAFWQHLKGSRRSREWTQ